MEKRVKALVYGGLFTALVALATMYLKVPTALGYANLGDGFFLAASVVLGPFAAIPAALGSALADCLLGYFAYAPATFVLKGLMGLAAGLLCRHDKPFRLRNVLVYALCECCMVAGYFGFEALLYGVAGATGGLAPNLVQGALGLVLACALTPVLLRLHERWK